MILRCNSISTKHFNFNKNTKTFVAEISCLPKGFNFTKLIYDDAADYGFSMVSEKTGRTVTFFFSMADSDREGDITGWRFEPIPEDTRRDHSLYGLSVLIIND